MSEPNDELKKPKPLTPTQKRLADAIRDLIHEHGYDHGLSASLTAVCFWALLPTGCTGKQLVDAAEQLHDILRKQVLKLTGLDRRN